MSASSREEFEKRQQMIRGVSGLDGDIPMTDASDDDAPMTDASSTESTSSSPSFKPISNVIQRLGRPIPRLPEHLGLTNLQSKLLKQTAAVLTLTSTFLDPKSQSELAKTCRRACLFKPSLNEAAQIAAQHLVDGNFLKADALFKKTRDQDKKALLDCTVEVTDHRKRKIKQRLFEILCMLGTRRANNQDIDLVEGWGSYLSPSDAERRRQAVLLTAEERALMRQPIINAIRDFLQAIIPVQAPNFEALKIALAPAIEVYKNAFVPKRNQVITSGYVFDPEIFCDFITMYRANVNQLGGWWSTRSDVFDIVGFGTLQFNASLWDFQVLRSGIRPVMEKNKKPNRSLTVASSDFQSLSGVGSSVVINIYDEVVGCGGLEGGRVGWVVTDFTKLCANKNSPLRLCSDETTMTRRTGV